MESSRLFVRGLPQNLTSDEFQRHFSKNAAVTDVKLIPNRRIGYVGYQTPADAANAVKYHNKSFIRMSRLHVELARSVETQHILTAQRATSNTTSGSGYSPQISTPDVENHRKRKLDRIDGPNLGEYLDVMQPPSKARIRAVEEHTSAQHYPQSLAPSFQVVEESENDGDHVAIRKKQSGGKCLELSEKAADFPSQLETEPYNTESPSDSARTANLEGSVCRTQPITSDDDWIRSKTSRLLGLLDEDEESSARPLAAGELRMISSIQPYEESQNKGRSDASAQTEGTRQHEADTNDTSPTQDQENIPTGRLFVRNLAYTVTEGELRQLFENKQYGTVEEVHLPLDYHSGSGKGYAYVQYNEAAAAQHALAELDGTTFQGRLLHIIPANSKKVPAVDDFTASKLPLKQQRQLRRRNEAASSTFNWNSMFMNTNAIMSSISDRLGVSKSEILSPTSSDAAIKQAHAETHIIQETKAYFSANGIDLDAFKRKERGNTAILVKNFPYEMKAEDLRTLFSTYGIITKFLVPPSGTIGIVEYERAEHAQSAFKGLAYRKVKDSILFLEKAPKDLFNGRCLHETSQTTELPTAAHTELDGKEATVESSTLFVRNLAFSTTSDRLREVFKPLDGFLSARVKMKPDPKKPGHNLSMGFGFLEFNTKRQAHAALVAMDGYNLDGHHLLIRSSHKAVDAAEERRKEDQAKKSSGKHTKIIIKNLPFETTKKDVRSLFAAYGQLRSVRVPKKFDMSTRGFAFAEFVTPKEAENAMAALRDTHLLGRRLVLDFSAEEAINPEEEIANMQRKVGRQADKVALQQLTGTARQKFNVGDSDEL